MKPEAGWSEPFHDAWMEHAGKPQQVRLAHAIVGQWLGSRMSAEPGELIVGHIENSSVVYWSFAGGVSFNRDLWNSRYSQADGYKPYLEEMRDEWHGKTSGEIIWPIVTPEERAVCVAQSPVAPGCHASPLHVGLASEGTEGLRRRVLDSRSRNLNSPATEPQEWYDALTIILDGIDAFGQKRYSRFIEIRQQASPQPLTWGSGAESEVCRENVFRR